ncbi:hypothetical protein EGW08_011367, partial [Elysia chlorotica]
MGSHAPVSLPNHDLRVLHNDQNAELDPGSIGNGSVGAITTASVANGQAKRSDLTDLRIHSTPRSDRDSSTDDLEIHSITGSIIKKENIICNGDKYIKINETATNHENDDAVTVNKSPETLNGIVITIECDPSEPTTDQSDSTADMVSRLSGQSDQGHGHLYSPLTRTSDPEGRGERLSSISSRMVLVAQASTDPAMDGLTNQGEEPHKQKTLSLRRVKGSFNHLDLEKLYKSYTVRNKHPLVVVYLTVLSLASLIFLGKAVFVDKPRASVESVGQIVTLCGSFLYFVTLLTLVLGPSRATTFFAHPKCISLAIVVGSTVIINLYFGFSKAREPTADVPPLFYCIVVSYMVLPLSRKWTLIYGGSTTLLHVAMAAALSSSTDELGLQMVCTFLVLACANLVGLGHKFLSDVVHRRAFLEARNSVESMLKLEKEKQQQDELLVSCIPSNFVKEIKRDLQDNMREPRPSLFHDLYVERYDNV